MLKVPMVFVATLMLQELRDIDVRFFIRFGGIEMISEKDKNKAQLNRHDIDSECLETCNYGLEYVAKEIVQENSNKAEKKGEVKKSQNMDWSGLSDLTIT